MSCLLECHGAPWNWNRRWSSGWKDYRTINSDESSSISIGSATEACNSARARQLRGKLRELRFYLAPSGDAVRIGYYIATGRRIILLIVFRKQRERAEIERAVRAMEKCIAEDYTLEDDGE